MRQRILFLPLVVLVGLAAVSQAAYATKPNPEHKVTICHRTDSYSNPYVQETVDVASILKTHGHDSHNGPVFFAGIPKHTKWGDIIPAFDFGPGEQYAGKNIFGGAIILDNGCQNSEDTTTTVHSCGCSTTTVEATTTTIGQETTTTLVGDTTTSAGNTTTTAGSTTTTEIDTATTVPTSVGDVTTSSEAATSTSGGNVVSTGTPPQNGLGRLPFTGSSTRPLVWVGGVMILTGYAMARSRRRRRA